MEVFENLVTWESEKMRDVERNAAGPWRKRRAFTITPRNYDGLLGAPDIYDNF